jgi:hypothetical protein
VFLVSDRRKISHLGQSLQRCLLDGTNQGQGNLPNGQGPVVLNNFVPTGAIATEVIPLFVTDIPSTLTQSMIDQVLVNQNFGLGYDNDGVVTGTAGTWYIITCQQSSTY